MKNLFLFTIFASICLSCSAQSSSGEPAFFSPDARTRNVGSAGKMEGIDGKINNGGLALAAYTKMQFMNDDCSEALAQALYRYCELDTMSMVFIWEFFQNRLKGLDS